MEAKTHAVIIGKGATAIQLKRKDFPNSILVGVNQSPCLADDLDYSFANDVEGLYGLTDEHMKNVKVLAIPEYPHFKGWSKIDILYTKVVETWGHVVKDFLIYNLWTTPQKNKVMYSKILFWILKNIWLNLLSKKNNNLCCVGDDDQSIYSWRGAEVKNILNFDKLNANTKVIKLEQNYRSTQNILDTASFLISNNEDRLGKKLWSENSKGDLIEVNCYNNGYDEAIAVADEIEKNLSKDHSLNQVSILVRAAFQTREFEDRFIKINLPYRVIGGLKFYDRAEIKDAISYIRIIYQENDDLAFERIINTPKRAIGDATLKEIHKIAKEKNINLEQASLIYCEQYNRSRKPALAPRTELWQLETRPCSLSS